MDYNKFKNQNGDHYESPYRNQNNGPQNYQNNNQAPRPLYDRKPEKRKLVYSEADKSNAKVCYILALVLQFFPWVLTAVYYFVFYLPNYSNAYIWFPDDESFEAFLVVVFFDCITFLASWIFMLMGKARCPEGALAKVTFIIFIVMLVIVIGVICRWIISCLNECTRCPG